MEARLHIEEKSVGGIVVLTLAGQLVADSGARAFTDRIDALVKTGALNVVVDLHDVSYLDSGGVGALVAKFISLRQRGGAMKLICLSGRACRVLRTAGLLGVLPAFESEAAALGSFAVPSNEAAGPPLVARDTGVGRIGGARHRS